MCKGRLTRTLQACDEDDGRIAFNIEVGLLTTHELGELVMHDLGDHLARGYGSEYSFAHGLLLHTISEILRYLVVDIRIYECTADLLDGFRDVDLCDLSLSFKGFKGSLEPFL